MLTPYGWRTAAEVGVFGAPRHGKFKKTTRRKTGPKNHLLHPENLEKAGHMWIYLDIFCRYTSCDCCLNVLEDVNFQVCECVFFGQAALGGVCRRVPMVDSCQNVAEILHHVLYS